jgi:hypothetical protein
VRLRGEIGGRPQGPVAEPNRDIIADSNFQFSIALSFQLSGFSVSAFSLLRHLKAFQLPITAVQRNQYPSKN